MVGAADVGLREEQDGGRDTGVRAEDAGRQLDDGVELLVLDEHPAQLLMRLGRAEQHAVGHDDRGAAAELEQAEEQREEEQLGLLGLDDLLQVLRASPRSRASRRRADWRGPGCSAPSRRRCPRRASRGSRCPGSRCRAGSCSWSRCAASCCRSRSRGTCCSWKCSRSFGSRSTSGWCSRRYSPAATRKPQVPQAGSQMMSVGVGSVSSTISGMMWRGVRNWPFCPAVAILPSMYS